LYTGVVGSVILWGAKLPGGCTYILTSFALRFVSWGLAVKGYWYRPASR